MRLGRRCSNLSHIRGLDPAKDHCEIMRLLVGQEFAWDYQRSLIDMVFLRSLAAPRISGLIGARGYLQALPQKRYDDTAIMMVELVKAGYDSERGAQVIERLNHVHAQFRIHLDDYLYILTALMLEPVRWNARFGWRPMCEQERLANFYFWREVGRHMHLTDIPDSFEACERFNQDYERQYFRRTRQAVELSRTLFGLLESWMPAPVRPLVRPGMSALLDDSLLDHFAIPHPPRWLRTLVTTGLRLRARTLRWLPTRRRPRYFVDGRIRSYPTGYQVQRLGPPDDWLPPSQTAAAEKTEGD